MEEESGLCLVCWLMLVQRIHELEREARALAAQSELMTGAGAGGDLLTEGESMQAEMDRAPEENEEQFADEVDQGQNQLRPCWGLLVVVAPNV